MTNLVEVRNLRIKATTDAGRVVEIIKGVSLDIADGEIIALIGESGSGKTTVALSLMGHARPGCQITGGEINVNGKNMAALSEKERAKLRGTDIAYVPQSAAASFNPASTIMEQVIEVTRIHRLMPPEQARKRAVELFRSLSLPDPERIGGRYPHQVSGGQLQRLAAAMALIGNPKLVIFDEPTTALDVTTQIDVLKAFKSVMRAGGIAGVYVSHDLAVVAQIADRIVVLKGGEVQETGTTAEILSAAKHPYTRELLAAFEPKRRQAHADAEPATNQLLRIDNVTAGYGAVRDNGLPLVRAVDSVSLIVEKGRNLGVIGESGCGKSTLARVIAGIHPAAAGDIVFDGKPLRRAAGKRSQDQLREMQIVFQYADTALNPAKPVEDIIARPLVFYHGLDRQARSRRVDELLDMVRLPKALRYRHPAELSGGQKQRVNFARALAANPKLIICDEITSALDTVVASAVIELLKELQRELGLSYIFISHDLSVVEAICDEIMVMYNGQRVEQITPDKVKAATHPYSKLLFSSVPKLDPTWLDGLVRDPELVSQYGHR
ncbi:ABC transporter ATP-binding protein [Mesorhizobium sp. M2D.F.Ca.ET.185.01.1.1]|uniref:ABC transporter ATP-binding protein n=1 Tax=unclassified Mesorhizobium TaxID=325217 RepID=UPI000FCCDAAC|nr:MULTISPECIES: ABC transporter ATP-binding protein [unclassified Mesorhizobium]TGP73891.1 ABC transporter ATP-binding protein [bacterium M00.F.Ca.ET.227.01.1.1]TGP85768.1 ABC transporter ATP-binding protein [bacterium M00.F.Ca.ET.221.01.1.1]TGP90995.1 ABC transporter ATP-binding protein [bacterium M00.F.Ca.ET.222.01.1.1]TGT68798.1 ABC transporter ATP-binding protein [bacterium M00.F.Ca.ET.159.01.1.1]TGT80647.1 ABC transporter ATP-binding protein [bacterium M00.F.Ca.ET.157.01.1.1]TGU03050.1 